MLEVFFNKLKHYKGFHILKEITEKYLPVWNVYKNLYKTDYPKNVLISYITYPIRKSLLKKHTNFLELYSIAEVFRDLKFNVDIVNYTYQGKINYSKYDVIFGFGYPFGKSFHDKSASSALKICYLTGSLKLFNQMERNKYLRERKGKVVIPRRNYYWHYLQESISMSDGIIVTGNDWTKSTVEPYNSRVFKVRLPIFLPNKEDVIRIIQKKDFENLKRHFLWFGSYGALHKGLDLCLDIFANNKDLFLHVCGPVEKEEDFFELYREELTNKHNIRYYGFVDIESRLFYSLVESCVFAIFPSCSEGGGGSLLTVMSYGLIPIATIESSVDIDDFGFLLTDYRIEHIFNVIKNAINLSSDQLKDMAIRTMEYVHSNHSKDIYKQDLMNALRNFGL